MGLGAEWVSKKAREKVIFKLDFEGPKKMRQLEGVVSTRFPGRRSSMNKGIKIRECGVYH